MKSDFNVGDTVYRFVKHPDSLTTSADAEACGDAVRIGIIVEVKPSSDGVRIVMKRDADNSLWEFGIVGPRGALPVYSKPI
jgi:predicted component of type VI protein secretion system